MLLVASSLLDLLINNLLPGDMLGIWHLLLCKECGHRTKHVGTKGLRRMEALSFNVDRQVASGRQSIKWNLRGLLVLHLLWLLLHVYRGHVDLGVLGHLSLILHRKRLLWLVLRLLLLHSPVLVVVHRPRGRIGLCIQRH